MSRATLARQLLLERVPLEPVEAVERLVALQAQEPASPHIALWSRLANFRASDLNAAFDARQVVKGTLLRVTLHVVSASDYPKFWPGVRRSLERWRSPHIRRLGLEPELERLGALAAAFAGEPRTMVELREHLPQLSGGVGPAGQTDSWWAVRPILPFLNAPGEPPWSFGRRPRLVAARAWLGTELAPADEGLDHFVRRYLVGFGPAGVDDLHRFSLVAVSDLRAALARLEPALVTFRDERGRLLYDVADGLRPPGDTPAPVRFLPMWDSLLLAYHDRSRVLPERFRRRVIQPNGDFMASFMVDGLVAGLWRADVVAGRTRVTPLPFEPLEPAVLSEVAAEAERLATFIEPLEPAVYSRYTRTWLKDD
ncbi:MAG: winged helix DNA-binding domain-containing protein [Candidatus Limnocylindrales bacterium]